MTLLERVEAAGAADRPKQVDDRVSRELRDMLFATLPASKIADLMEDDIKRAAREVRAALESALRDSAFATLRESERELAIKSVSDMVIGLGPLQDLMDDPDVTEIMANGPGSVFYEKDGVLHKSNAAFSGKAQMRVVIDRVLAPVGRRVDEQSPMVSARLPGGHRVNVVIAPLALDGPLITIRKFRNKMYTLEEMVELGTLDEPMARFLSWAVRARRNIAVSGGTGSGKTTFLNALSVELPHDERVITIEDSAELRFDEHPHVVRLESRAKNTEGTGEVSIRDLVTNALRMRPDRIIVGECRSDEALDMLQAMSTGHDGSLTTLHANSTQEVVGRLVTMVRFGTDLPVDAIEEQIASAINLIVHVERCRDGRRRVREIAECSHGDAGGVKLEPCACWNAGVDAYGWRCPGWVDRLPEMGIASEEEVETWRSGLQPLLEQ